MVAPGTTPHIRKWPIVTTKRANRRRSSRPSSQSRFEEASRRVNAALKEAAHTVEKESEVLIAYLNDEVVPAVREHSSRGLRIASKKLAEFATYLDSTKKKPRR